MTVTEYRCSLESFRAPNDTIRLQHCRGSNQLDISFKRTIRVPDNDQVNYLPPDLGYFPLYKIKDYADNLPTAMVAKGGLFMPMYQREAMWIRFRANEPFLIKIYCGGINIVSGEHANEDMATKLRRQTLRADKKSLQDYMTVPKQPWIDGIAAKPGFVKQFVAMPLGTGYSVEAQLTGKDSTGGLQFEVTPAVAVRNRRVPGVPKKITKQDLPKNESSFNVYIKTLTGKTITLFVNSSDTIEDLETKIENTEGIPPDQQRFVFSGKRLEPYKLATLISISVTNLQLDNTIGHYKITNEATIHLILRLCGGGDPEARYLEMGIAPGGLIEQSIVRDTYPRRIWHETLTTSFNVQILNSTTFRQVTGQEPPKSPVTAEAYAKAGLPFFKMWEEPSAVHGLFDNVKSVATIDDKKEPTQQYQLIHLASDAKPISTLNKGSGSTRILHIDDPHGIVNKNGPLRSFRTIGDLENQMEALSFASFDRDEETV